ncbi:MAG: hypothetical protein PHE16_12110 [Aliarcobacter sp.]|nr:hypothetical protein [Aliarcobacter sp.]
MALINCPECNHSISDIVDTLCPKCGYKHTQENINKEIEKLKNMPLWKQFFGATLGIIIIVAVSIFLIGVTASEEVRYVFGFLILALIYKSWNKMEYAHKNVKIYFSGILFLYSLSLFFIN